MALMFPRLARNFIRNGYYPTDEGTLERVLTALQPDTNGTMRILDPCAGEGVAIAEIAHHLDHERVQSHAVEYDAERAAHTATLTNCCLHSDLMETIILQQAFSLLYLNPPYGDQVTDQLGQAEDKQGRTRLEKLFYQRTVGNLQYGGILVFIIPYYTLDKELTGWLANGFNDIQIFSAADPQFKQVVIFGKRVRQNDRSASDIKTVRHLLRDIGQGILTAPALPEQGMTPYRVPASRGELKHFYRATLEPVQFSQEVERLKGLWPTFTTQLCLRARVQRQPVRQLSRWHLALALAAGAITGVITSPSGRTLVVKGDTYKTKDRKTDYSEDEDGNINETVILTDRFIPAISAWDMTPDSPTFGQLLSIR